MFAWQKHEKVVCVERCFRYWDHPFYYLLSVSVCAIARHAYAQLLASFKVHIINQPPSPCTVRKENIIQLYIHCKSFFIAAFSIRCHYRLFARRLLRKVASAVRRIKKRRTQLGTLQYMVTLRLPAYPTLDKQRTLILPELQWGHRIQKGLRLSQTRSVAAAHVGSTLKAIHSRRAKNIPIRCCLARKTVTDLFGSLIRQYFAFVRCRGMQ